MSDQTPSATTAPRVVLLTKPNHLGIYLEESLARAGFLAGTVFEIRAGGLLRNAFDLARRTLRREGVARTLDVFGYEFVDKVIRGREYHAACEAILPLDSQRPGVERYEAADLNAEATVAHIKSLAPDVLVVHATGILRPATFALAQKLALNIHCGVLPEYRGHASTFWALSRHDFGNVGVTIHEVAAKVDTGRYLRVGRIDLAADDNDLTAWLRAFKLGADLTLEVLRELSTTGMVASLPMPTQHGPHYRRRGLSDHLQYLRNRGAS